MSDFRTAGYPRCRQRQAAVERFFGSTARESSDSRVN